jgi:hypothetical protein
MTERKRSTVLDSDQISWEEKQMIKLQIEDKSEALRKHLEGMSLHFGSVGKNNQDPICMLGLIGSSDRTCIFRLVPTPLIFGRSVLVQYVRQWYLDGSLVCPMTNQIQYWFSSLLLLLVWSVWIWCPNKPVVELIEENQDDITLLL